MSAELVASAHKTVHISLSRDGARLGSDGAILIERAFAELAPVIWRCPPQSFAPRLCWAAWRPSARRHNVQSASCTTWGQHVHHYSCLCDRFPGLCNDRYWAWGLFYLLYSRPGPTPLRYFAMMIAMICSGFGLGGIAQGLRVLVAIVHVIQPY
jgi:hypothetical protein